MKTSNEEARIKGGKRDRGHQHSSEKQAVVMDKAFVTNAESRDPNHHPHMRSRMQEKEGALNRELEVYSGERSGYV